LLDKFLKNHIKKCDEKYDEIWKKYAIDIFISWFDDSHICPFYFNEFMGMYHSDNDIINLDWCTSKIQYKPDIVGMDKNGIKYIINITPKIYTTEYKNLCRNKGIELIYVDIHWILCQKTKPTEVNYTNIFKTINIVNVDSSILTHEYLRIENKYKHMIRKDAWITIHPILNIDDKGIIRNYKMKTSNPLLRVYKENYNKWKSDIDNISEVISWNNCNVCGGTGIFINKGKGEDCLCCQSNYCECFKYDADMLDSDEDSDEYNENFSTKPLEIPTS
jgi:hypothetical protein